MVPGDVEFEGLKRRLELGSVLWRKETSPGISAPRLRLPLSFETESPPGPTPLRVFLNHQGRCIDHRWTGLSPERVIAHELVDPDFQLIRKRLFGPGPKSVRREARPFEEGVAWLLHLCGYSAVHYGHNDVQRAPDVVAFLDDSQVLYAECSIELPDRGKLADIRSRAAAFAQAASGTGRQVYATPAVCVPLLRSQIPFSDKDAASDERVTLVPADDLESALEMAVNGEAAQRIDAVLRGFDPDAPPLT